MELSSHGAVYGPAKAVGAVGRATEPPAWAAGVRVISCRPHSVPWGLVLTGTRFQEVDGAKKDK